MKKLIITMVSLVFALSVPMFAVADMGHPDGGMHKKEACCAECSSHKGFMGHRGGMRHGRMGWARMFKAPKFYLAHSKELKLTDDQKASLKKISFDLRKDMIAKGADVKVRMLELREMLSTPDYKLEDATAKLKDIADARLALATALLQHTVQARDVLTPEQLKAVKDLKHERRCGKGGCCGKEMKGHMDKKKAEEK
ncbi:MAG: Spy/CpxP family protein refolding chaperone [Nitrospirota bacterium]